MTSILIDDRSHIYTPVWIKNRSEGHYFVYSWETREHEVGDTDDHGKTYLCSVCHEVHDADMYDDYDIEEYWEELW